MASGITVNDECVAAFNELKTGKAYRFVTFKVADNNKEIVIDQKVGRSATWDDFKAALPRDEPRYAIYDLEFSLGESGDRKKVVLVSW
jgi:cofilin